MQCIKYKAGYKYQLKSNYAVTISIKPPADITTPYITLNAQGMLTLKDGYAWDGPSGPTIDTLTFMRGSLIHDALYQLMREGKLDHDRLWVDGSERSDRRSTANRIEQLTGRGRL